ncbi:MAG TPA: type II toxin-antitoxin system HicB family antitoxin [Longimicrobium sp.]|nr:type II toxin-antitoxin system HicB family antitoxin [Longimicrobium sp.]
MDRYSYNVFWSDDDGGYIAISPEFPRLSAFGKTAELALAELRGVLEAAIEQYGEEGWPLPVPQTHGEHSGQFRVRVAKSLHSALVQRAEAEGISMNSLVSQYLARGLGHDAALSRAEHDYRELLREFTDATPSFRR